MPLDVESAKELKQLIGLARKMALNFGLALGKKPENTALIMHRKKKAALLYKEARKADGVEMAKSCFGTLGVKGSLLTFTCESDPPAGMKKKCKAYFKDNKIAMKVAILAPGGEEFEAGADDDDPREDDSGAKKEDGGDQNKAKWEELAKQIQPKLVAALKAGKGDTQKMRAVWGLATEKAEAGNYDAAKQALSALLTLMKDAAQKNKTEAQEQSGSVVSDTATGKELLDELKGKIEAIKAALALLPDRVAEGKQLISDVQQGVKDTDLDFARVALTKIDMLLRDAEPIDKARKEFKLAEGRISSRAAAMADLPPDAPGLSDLLKAYQTVAATALDAADGGDWVAARATLPAWAKALDTLEKAYREKLDVEGQYKMAEAELTPRATAIKDLPPKAPGMDVILAAYQTAVMAAVDLADQKDWAGALTKVPEWRNQLALAEAAYATYVQNKKTFDDIDGPLQADLAQAMKLGAVTPAMGVLCKAVRDQAPLAKAAGEALDYGPGVGLIQELATRVAALLEARKDFVAARQEWGSQSGALGSKIAQVEGCGTLDATLDPLKAAFDTAIADARTKAKAKDYAGALTKLGDVRTKADAFLLAKANYDQARDQVFDEARRAGADDIPVILTAGQDDGATIDGIETAMQDSKSLAKSKGLQALVAEAKELDALFAQIIAQADPAVVQTALAQFQTAIVNCEAYQRDHKETARSKDDRAKFAQADSLADHYRTMVGDIIATLPVLTTLDDIDTKALASNEAGALKAIGQIDAIKDSALCKAVKDLAEKKRRELVANMMQAATTPDQIREVAMMAGGDFKESYERQMALGPLTKTAGESRTAKDHQSTRIQPPADAANVDETRRLADRLITDDGRLELAALYACNPEELAGDAPSSRQTARALKRLRNDPEAIEILENIQAPEKGSPAARMVCATLGLEAGTTVTDAQTRQAALSSLLAELRQKDVGSCFATQVAVNLHDTNPKRYLQDMSDMLSKGAITRTVNGETVTVPIETVMSDAALETNTVKLSRGDNPDLLGSSNGGKLGEKTKLEEAPAFQAAFDTLGVDPDNREAAMAAALKSMQDSDEFKRNQNAKALKAGVATIADKDKRDKVFKAAMALLEADGDNVKTALAAAMVTEGVPDADPANQLAAANTAKDAFDTIATSDEFDVEPGMVVRQLVMDKIGLSDAEIAKQKEYEAAAAAFAKDTRPDSDPGRKTDMAEVERLQKECADIRPKILKMDELKAASYDAFTGGEDNRLLRAYEYTLTALAEESSNRTNLTKLQSVEQGEFKDELTVLLTDMKGNPAITMSDPDLTGIADTLFRRYQTLFGDGTMHAYDASIQADEVSADGNSSRGGFYLYDIRGIPSPADWIKIDDAKKYQALVKGTMMLAWKEEYGDHDDPAMQETSRFMAEEMGKKIASDGFVTKTVDKAKDWLGKESTKPWQIQDGGNSEDVLEILEERTPTKTSLGPAPANSKELFQQIGNQLETLWNSDASLRDAADEDPEVATVNAGNKGVHAFSLTPGDPKLRAILESGDVSTAIDTFQNEETAKWDDLLNADQITTKEEAKAYMVEYGIPSNDGWVNGVWNLLDNGTHPKTGKGVIAAAASGISDAKRDGFKSHVGGNIAQKLIPPIEPADLQNKLDKVAAKLGVPPDMVAAVTKRAKDALDTKDPAKATMGDIKDEIAKAMTAEGMDAASVDQKAVNDALREPVGIIFADSNWGNAEHRIKYAMVVNPVSGQIEMWQMNEDGSGARKMDDDQWVKKEWSTVT